MSLLRYFIALASFFVFSGIALAATLTELANQKLRPTMAEVAAATGKIDMANQSPETDLNQTIEFLVGLEKHFPGAKYVTLGRDADGFGDAIDAILTALGQKGRVERLGVSSKDGNSFGGNGEKLVRLMEQKGLDLDPKAKNPQAFILIDTVTGGGMGFQPRTLLNFAYKEYVKRGGDPVDLVGRLNMVGMGGNGQLGADLDGAKAKLDNQAKAFKGKKNGEFFTKTNIITRSSYGNHPTKWYTSGFGALTESAGKVKETHGPIASLAARLQVVAFMRARFEFASQPTFIKKFLNIMAKAGVTMTAKGYTPPKPMTPTEFLAQFKATDKKILEGKKRPTNILDALKSDLDKKPKEIKGKKLSENGKLISEFIDANVSKYNADVFVYDFIEFLYKVRTKLNSYDRRKLANQALGYAQPSTMLANRLGEYANTSNTMKKILTSSNLAKGDATGTVEDLMNILALSKACTALKLKAPVLPLKI